MVAAGHLDEIHCSGTGCVVLAGMLYGADGILLAMYEEDGRWVVAGDRDGGGGEEVFGVEDLLEGVWAGFLDPSQI